jgi:hypothetical protein
MTWKKKTACRRVHRHLAQLIDDENLRLAVLSEFRIEAGLLFGLFELVNHLGGRTEQYRVIELAGVMSTGFAPKARGAEP